MSLLDTCTDNDIQSLQRKNELLLDTIEKKEEKYRIERDALKFAVALIMDTCIRFDFIKKEMPDSEKRRLILEYLRKDSSRRVKHNIHSYTASVTAQETPTLDG